MICDTGDQSTGLPLPKRGPNHYVLESLPIHTCTRIHTHVHTHTRLPVYIQTDRHARARTHFLLPLLAPRAVSFFFLGGSSRSRLERGLQPGTCSTLWEISAEKKAPKSSSLRWGSMLMSPTSPDTRALGSGGLGRGKAMPSRFNRWSTWAACHRA